jgi:acetylglutamate kinase
MVRPIVIKYGGSLLEDPDHQWEFLKDVAKLSKKQRVLLVHGGGKEINRQMEAAGLQARFVGGRRYTDEVMMSVVENALSKLNARIVDQLKSLGVKAQGFSGRDQHFMEAQAIPELGRAGQPSLIDEPALDLVLAKARLPVFYSVAEDISHEPLNVNADDFALALAIGIRAQRLVFLTDAGAILDTSRQPLGIVSETEVEALIEKGVITGGMIIKARACAEALRRGVGRVDICKGIKNLLSSRVAMDGTAFVHNPEEQN